MWAHADPPDADQLNQTFNICFPFSFSTPSGSPDRDSIKKTPIDDDDDEDSLADYGEGYGDIGQYGTDTKKEKNGQTMC